MVEARVNRVARFFFVQHIKRGVKDTNIFIPRPSKIYPNWYFWFEKYTVWQPCGRPFLDLVPGFVKDLRTFEKEIF
jgi:hypothetical protein